MHKRRRLSASTVIFDPVHREYELGPELIDIINSPKFQRLRRLKQLATAQWVWLGATHTRFEHSISVAYLAGHMAKKLQQKQPDLNITDRQILLVQLGGLLHDVGHGPFSHLFDDVFLSNTDTPMAHHEHRSVVITADLLKNSQFEYSAEEIVFVQSLIAPASGQEGFFWEIVANQVSHLDVDKMEYIKRDARACGLSQGGFDTDTMRIINAARVINGHICYHYKVYEDIYNLFLTRYRLHTTVYRHPAVVSIHYMVSDALKASELPLEQSIKDIDTFCKYDDTILDQLRFNDKNQAAQQIIHRIDRRELYKVALTEKRAKPWTTTPSPEQLVAVVDGLPAETIIIDCSCVGFIGKVDKHPMDALRFYDSQNPTKDFSIKRGSISTLLSARYCEYWTRVIVRDSQYVQLAIKAWETWKSSI